MRPRRATSPALVLAVLVVLVAGVFALTQPPIDRNQGQGFDGVQYHQMAEQLRQGEPVRAEAPFVFRIGTPLAAGVVSRTLGTPTLGAFAIVNLLAAAGFLALLYRYLRTTGSSSRWASILVMLAATAWVMPLRFTLFYPAVSDPLFLVALVAALLALERGRAAALSWRDAVVIAAIVAAGALCREQMLVVGLAAAVQSLSHGRRRPAEWFRAGLPMLAGGVASAAARLAVDPVGTYDYASEAVDWLSRHSLDSMVLALFLAFGLVVSLAIALGDSVVPWLLREPYRVVVTAGVLTTAWVGGSDTERLLVPLTPLLFAAVGRALTDFDWVRLGPMRRRVAVAAGALVVVFAQGLFLPLRDDLSPFDQDAGSLLREHHAVPILSVVNAPTFTANHVSLAPALFQRALIAEWIAVTLAAIVLLRPHALRRLCRSPPPADDAELTVPTANEPPGRPGGDEPTDTGTRPDRPRGTIT